MGRKGEREGEKHQCVLASHMPPSGDLANKPGMCPDWESNQQPLVHRPAPNPWSHTSQGSNTHLKKKKKNSGSGDSHFKMWPYSLNPNKVMLNYFTSNL